MARLPYVDIATVDPHVRRGLERLPPLNLFRMLVHAESAMRPLQALGAAVLGQANLDPRVREFAILRVAARSRAQYEWIQHVEVGLAAGLTNQQIEALSDLGGEHEVFDSQDRALLAFVDEVLGVPDVTDGTFDAVRELLEPREIVELLIAIGYYRMLAGVMTTLEVDLDAPSGNAVVAASGRSQQPRDASDWVHQ
jgi:4-carboxymuconolactone decarboxylase